MRLLYLVYFSHCFFSTRHEHLYTSIRTNTITSGEFSGRLSQLNGCPVVLCTLSMLSNDTLRKQGVFRRVPLHTVVVDEASQIEVGDYIPLFTNFSTIRKAIFIGDNMQCRSCVFCIVSILKNHIVPPHGQDDIQELQSVFEVGHLMKSDSTTGKTPFIFLDTQCKFSGKVLLFND